MKIYNGLVLLKEIAKIRDKLIKKLEKEKGHIFTSEELKYNPPEEINDSCIDWVIDEINNSFDFQGEEDENR